MKNRRILTIMTTVLLAVCTLTGGCKNSQAAISAIGAVSSNVSESGFYNMESAKDNMESAKGNMESAKDNMESAKAAAVFKEARDYTVYKAVTEKLFREYGKFRVTPWLGEMEDPDRSSREVNGVCYLRLLDFDNDGDLELYAVCKNEGEENYTGRVYAAENGTDPIFEGPVNSKLGYWIQSIGLVCKGGTKYYVHVCDYPDGRGGKDTMAVYGYDPDHPGEFTYTRISTLEEKQRSDETWYTEYRIRDDAVSEDWKAYDEAEYNDIEKAWWADVTADMSLTVRSSSGEVDRDQLIASLTETMQLITGGTNVEVAEDGNGQNTQSVQENQSPFYGIWCAATKDEEGAQEIASAMREYGLPAEVLITTDWSNLNKEKWYVISAGRYASREEAEKALPQVKDYYDDAYIKYSGDYTR